MRVTAQLRRLALSGALALGLAIAGCSSASPISGTTGATAPQSASSSVPGALSAGSQQQYPVVTTASDPAGASDGVGPLPGLSQECSTVIHGQSAANALFAAALATGAPSSDENPVDSAVLTATEAPSSSAGEQPVGITANAVTEAFAPFTDALPPEVKPAFATLHTAAVAAVGKPATKVSDLLGSDDVMDAITTIADYIKACTPQVSH